MSGYADGDFLEITFNSDHFTSYVGTDGEVSRSKTNDNTATITIRLAQTSPTNDLLSAIVQGDLLAGGGAGIGAFLVTDIRGTSLYTAANCWITKTPDATYGRDTGERAWTMQCDLLRAFVGGNL